MPPGGYYYDSVAAPLSGSIDAETITAYPWPDASDPTRYEGMAERARQIACDQRRAVHVNPICSGLIEGLFKLRGFEDGYMNLAANPDLARQIMERLLDIKLTYWERALPLLKQWADIAGESDDLGGQRGLLFSPKTYRELVKPLHAQLFDYIHTHSGAQVFFHSCGAIRELIPDLLEIGVDILNPVQTTADGMASDALKRDYGRDLVFWGGGVDTQGVLWSGTTQQVREDVRQHVRDLKPGGGFVFAAVHNIQANVPPENLLAMWEGLAESGTYDD